MGTIHVAGVLLKLQPCFNSNLKLYFDFYLSLNNPATKTCIALQFCFTQELTLLKSPLNKTDLLACLLNPLQASASLRLFNHYIILQHPKLNNYVE